MYKIRVYVDIFCFYCILNLFCEIKISLQRLEWNYAAQCVLLHIPLCAGLAN